MTALSHLTGPPDFPIWRTVNIGTHKSPAQYRKALKKGGNVVSVWADATLGKIPCAQKTTRTQLVNVSVRDLGLNKAAIYRDVCDHALHLGLYLCPPEIGPALRLQYKDQPPAEWLFVAMHAITLGPDWCLIFVVGHLTGERWLYAPVGHPEYRYRADERFLFVRPQ